MKMKPLYISFAKAIPVALATYFICILFVVLIEEILKIFNLYISIPTYTSPWLTNMPAAFIGWVFFRWAFTRILPDEKLDLRVSELTPHLRNGLSFGIVIISVSAVALYCIDQISIHEATFIASDIAIFSVTITPLVEEILFRGVIQRYLTESWGPTVGITVAALSFGFIHIFNDNATIWACLNIAAGSGVLFGLLYYATNNLWPAVGAHAGWNLAEGVIWGSPNSGAHIPGFLEIRPTGNPVLSGGAFGLEASILVTTICIICSFLIIRRLNYYAFSRRSNATMRNDAG